MSYVRIILCCFIMANATAQSDYASERRNMVTKQIEARGVKDKATINAMLSVKRHLFVPDKAKKQAYWDMPLSIGEGQTISQPYIVAFMTSALKVKKTDRVLEIGTGSGYQAAVLAKIADSVFTIEIVEPLGIRAKKTLETLNYNNVEVRIGDGYHGWEEKAPFDAIIVTAAIDKVPQPLIDQMAEGGRLIIPVIRTFSGHELRLLTKKNGKIKEKSLLPVRFVPFTREKNE